MKELQDLELMIESILDQEGTLARMFSNYEFRPEQIRMSKAVAASLVNETPLLVEAGTGTGKTMAYLIPAICSGQKIVVSTGTKNLQEQIYLKDIPLLSQLIPRKFLVCNVKGRGNYLCQRRWKEFLHHARLGSPRELEIFRLIQAWTSKTRLGDRGELDFLADYEPLWEEINSKRDFCLGQKCGSYRDCFISRLRQAANEADLIIVNHHLFFSDLLLKDTTHSEVLPRYQGVIFDEGHQLEDIATEYFGLSVSNYQIQDLIQDIRRELDQSKIRDTALTDALNLLGQRAGAFFMQFPPGLEKKRLRPDMVSTLLGERQQALAGTMELVSSFLVVLKSKSEVLHACERRSREIQENLHFIMEMADPEYVYWVESRTKAVYLHASPIDVSGDLHRLLFGKIKRTILTSATLSVDGSFDYIKSRLGLDPSSTTELVLQSHFDYSSQAMIYIPTHLPDPQNAEFIARAAEEIERIVTISRGRAFVLFTSYKNLDQIHRLLQGKLPYQILRQGERSKSALLAEFKSDVHSILLATSSFSGGYRCAGRRLKLRHHRPPPLCRAVRTPC